MPTSVTKKNLTKAERATREQAEAAMKSSAPIVKWATTKKDRFASKQFDRILAVFDEIGLNDGSYEAVLNRYCELLGECRDLKERMKTMRAALVRADEAWTRCCERDEPEMSDVISYTKAVSAANRELNGLDAALGAKRNALLQIEKDNVMTVLAKLRAIPKKPVDDEEEDDPMTGRLASIENIKDRRRAKAHV